MIPKIIHYCWFGRNPLPESAKKCIASWRKFLPDYEIWQWSEEPLNGNENEDEDENRLFDKIQVFDVNIIPYTQQAYEAKKYAFVSDYARFWILYKHGGLYFDTDVEVIKAMDDIIERGPFMGIEKGARIVAPIDIEIEALTGVAPGLGLGAEACLPIYKELLDYYVQRKFFDSNGNQSEGTIVSYTTTILYKYGLHLSSDLQRVAGLWIYPEDVFCPMDSTTGITIITDRTVSIHHYDCSWMNHKTLRFRLHLLKNMVNRILHFMHLR